MLLLLLTPRFVLVALVASSLLVSCCSPRVLAIASSSSPLSVWDSLTLTPAANASLANATLAAMNTSVDPCVDFYDFACGGWIATTKLPPSSGSISRAFSLIGARNEATLLAAVNDSAPSSLLGGMYRACANVGARDVDALPRLRVVLESLRATPGDALAMAGATLATTPSTGAFFAFSTAADASAPPTIVIYASQGGLALPARELYNDTKVMTAYRSHVAAALALVFPSLPSPSSVADDVVRVEAALAAAQTTPATPFDAFNRLDVGTLESMSHLNVSAYLAAAQLPHSSTTTIVVDNPAFFVELGRLLADTDDATLRMYVAWTVIAASERNLNSAFESLYFDFFGRVLGGASEDSSLVTRCIAALNTAVPEALGAAFVAAEPFTEAEKAAATDLIERVQEAMGVTIRQAAFMDEKTRKQALTKWKMILRNVGYPSPPDSYDGLNASTHHLENVISAYRYAFEETRTKLGTAASRTAWQMSANTVNAYYDPLTNTINFPAGILSAPYFYGGDRVLSASGAGFIAGHEITHGFDNNGADYRGNGELSNWWTPESRKQFNEATQCLVEQYSKFEVAPGHFVNGEQTLGENIADGGGATNSFRVLASLLDPKAPSALLPRFTNAQMHALHYAQTWCAKSTQQAAIEQTLTDVHSPPKFRVLGPMQNSQEFRDAWKCATGTPMAPEKMCTVW